MRGKSGWEKQKEEEAKEEAEKKREEKDKKRKQKKGKTMEIKKVVEKWGIWDEKEEVKKIVPEKFHLWIKVFRKKQSERMLIRKIWDHVIELKERFVLRKGKIYPLSREKREKVREFIQE